MDTRKKKGNHVYLLEKGTRLYKGPPKRETESNSLCNRRGRCDTPFCRYRRAPPSTPLQKSRAFWPFPIRRPPAGLLTGCREIENARKSMRASESTDAKRNEPQEGKTLKCSSSLCWTILGYMVRDVYPARGTSFGVAACSFRATSPNALWPKVARFCVQLTNTRIIQ